jgi:hypothetical protein
MQAPTARPRELTGGHGRELPGIIDIRMPLDGLSCEICEQQVIPFKTQISTIRIRYPGMPPTQVWSGPNQRFLTSAMARAHADKTVQG